VDSEHGYEPAPADAPKVIALAPPAVKDKACRRAARSLTAAVAGAEPPIKAGRRGVGHVPNPL
jgi:hypothetical protein